MAADFLEEHLVNGMELLNTHNGGVLDAFLLPLLEQIIVDLAGAEDEFFSVLRRDGIVQYFLKEPGGEVLYAGDGTLVSQEALRGEDYKWAFAFLLHLPAQCMK